MMRCEIRTVVGRIGLAACVECDKVLVSGTVAIVVHPSEGPPMYMHVHCANALGVRLVAHAMTSGERVSDPTRTTQGEEDVMNDTI